MKIGERIRQARVKQGLTVSGLAEAARLSKGFISQVESGRSNPSVDSLGRIAYSLHVPLSELLGERSEHPTWSGVPTRGRMPRVSKAQLLGGQASALQFMGSEDHRRHYVASLAPGAALVPPALGKDSGGSCGVVVEGEIEFSQSPVHALLSGGDVVTWDASRRYRFENKGQATARVFLELSDPAGLPLVLDLASRSSERLDQQKAYSTEGPLKLAAMRAGRHAKSGR